VEMMIMMRQMQVEMATLSIIISTTIIIN
jgi:hypothetical protein